MPPTQDQQSKDSDPIRNSLPLHLKDLRQLDTCDGHVSLRNDAWSEDDHEFSLDE